MASSSHLKPGESGVVRVLIDTRNKIGSRIIKTVKVFSNDPSKPKVILTVKAAL